MSQVNLLLNEISTGKANEILPLRSTCRARPVCTPSRLKTHGKAGQLGDAIVSLYAQKLRPVPCRALKPALQCGVCTGLGRQHSPEAPDLGERLCLVSWKQSELHVFKAKLDFKN